MKPDWAASELSEIRTASYCATVELAHEAIGTLQVGVIPMEYDVLALDAWPL